MFVVRKGGDSIINMNEVACMYVGMRGSIKVNYVHGDGCLIADYGTEQEAQEALKMLAESIGKTDVFFFPEDEVVRMRVRANGPKYHHMTGKKTKGHGGS